MSAEAALCAGVRAAIAGLPLNAIHDFNPARAREPFAVVEIAGGGDWSCKDRRGRELRVAVSIVTAGDDPAPLRALLADAGEAVEAMAPVLRQAQEAGWRVASCVLIRSRHAREREGRWRGQIEFRVRMMEDL